MLETFNEFRSSSLSDKFPTAASLIRSRVISAWARGLGFSLGLFILAGLPLGFIKPFFAALSRTSCAVSTGFWNIKQRERSGKFLLADKSYRVFQLSVVN